MKRLLLMLLAITCLLGGASVGDISHASIVPVKHKVHKHKAHKAAKHKAPRRNHKTV
jgi:hypothetical protein